MEPVEQEAKQDFESQFDAEFDKVEKEISTESSPETKPEDTQIETKPDAGAEPEKTELVKEVEADESLSAEDKIAKVKEILGDDLEAIDAYVKEKGYHNDPAWQKQRELIESLKLESEGKTALSEEDRVALEEFKTYRNSAEYIKSSMKAQGYTQEKIDEKLNESGYQVSTTPQDDVEMVVNKMGLDINNLSQQEKTYVDEVVKMANIIIDDKLSKILPSKLAPIEEHMQVNEQRAEGSKMIESMKDTIKSEAILDFDKDIEPALNKFMDENPDALQSHIFAHFKEINHSLTVERLKTGNNKNERDDKRNQIRHNTPGSSESSEVPARTGNFDKDSDAFFGAFNM